MSQLTPKTHWLKTTAAILQPPMDLGKAQQGVFLSRPCSELVAGAGTEGTGAAGGAGQLSLLSGYPVCSFHVASLGLPHHMEALGNHVAGYTWLKAPGQFFQQAKLKEHCLRWPSFRSHIVCLTPYYTGEYSHTSFPDSRLEETPPFDGGMVKF